MGGNLILRESLDKGIYIDNITDILVQNSYEALNVLNKGKNQKHIGISIFLVSMHYK